MELRRSVTAALAFRSFSKMSEPALSNSKGRRNPLSSRLHCGTYPLRSSGVLLPSPRFQLFRKGRKADLHGAYRKSSPDCFLKKVVSTARSKSAAAYPRGVGWNAVRVQRER